LGNFSLSMEHPPPARLFNGFLSLPWFTRRWVIQEASLGHDIVVHCGSTLMSWEWFAGGIAALGLLANQLQLNETGRAARFAHLRQFSDFGARFWTSCEISVTRPVLIHVIGFSHCLA